MIQSSPLEIHSELNGDHARLTLVGELDLATAPRVEQAVARALSKGARRIVLDLSELVFVDSSGVRLLIILDGRASGEGWTLALIRPGEPTLAVFKITGAEQNLPFEDPRSS